MEKTRQPEHKQNQDRLMSMASRIQCEVELSGLGRAMLKDLKGEARRQAAATAPRSGWVELGSVLIVDPRTGCPYAFKMRFVRHDEDESREMFRMIRIDSDGRAVCQ